MFRQPISIADKARLDLFARIESGFSSDARSPRSWLDDQGFPWAGVTVGGAVLAVSGLGPGWVFDETAHGRRQEEYQRLQDQVRELSTDKRQEKVLERWGEVRLGRLAARLLWLIHAAVLWRHESAALLPDCWVREVLWGPYRKNWPVHWRGEVRAILEGLTWLHAGNEGEPLGTATALLTHWADLRACPTANECGEHCPGQLLGKHSHFLVNVGRGFLGVIEQCAEEYPEEGRRLYPLRDPGRKVLKQLGRTGKLVPVFLPAYLGEPEKAGRLTSRQKRLLHTLLRETTRASRGEGVGPLRALLQKGNLISTVGGKATICCPFLEEGKDYLSFNGNGVRRALGYRLLSERGWVRRAGYALEHLEVFLADLQRLGDSLGVIAVGLPANNGDVLSLAGLRALAGAAVGRGHLRPIHLRLYAPADSLKVWVDYFGGLWTGRSTQAKQPEDGALELSQALARCGGRRARLATELQVDHSFLGKILNGAKRCPPTLLERVRSWLGVSNQPAVERSAPLTSPAIARGAVRSMLEVALAYRQRGWAVVPQVPGAKKPCVRWKQYQSCLPSEEELRSWFGKWPEAGLALVLGPVSGVFAVDVDGPEAHQALLQHLGDEPVAPKSLSGSSKPSRYHLFFRHPSMATRAKKTPWHKKLEFRGQGGIVILPPSLHRSGNCYQWAPLRSPEELELPPPPAAILEAIQASTKRRSPLRQKAPAKHEGQFSPSTQEFLSGRFAQGPYWNDRLYQASCDLAGRGVPVEEAESLLLPAASPWNEEEEGRALDTIASAYSAPREPGRS
jgi:hypothetical protein